MTWLWDNYEHFREAVQPVEVDNRAKYNDAIDGPAATRVSRLALAIQQMEASIQGIRDLDYKFEPGVAMPSDLMSAAHTHCIDLVEAGETALALHRPLANSDHAYGFLHQNEILTHWRRWAESSRIGYEIERLVRDCERLLGGYRDFVEADERFLVTDLSLPEAQRRDFLIARDLFSIGHDEMGVFAASRGLESVLRAVAKVRKLKVRRGKAVSRADELRLHDLIEYFYHLRWRSGGEHVLSKALVALLHYLRQVRNEGAHTGTAEAPIQPRETAQIIAAAATQLWQKIAKSRARFLTSTLDRNWGPVDGAI